MRREMRFHFTTGLTDYDVISISIELLKIRFRITSEGRNFLIYDQGFQDGKISTTF